MRKTIIGTLALAGALAACGGGAKGGQGQGDTLSRDLQLAPTDTGSKLADRPARSAPPAARPAPSAPVLARGTSFSGAARDTITSRHNKPGESMVVLVSNDVKDRSGRTVIPAGAPVTLHIDQLKSQSSRTARDSELHLTPVSVEIGGKSYPVSGTVDTIAYQFVGRGITAGTAAKVGVGAAVGAVLGRVIGGNKTGTIVGGVAGAAGGAAVADQTGDRDVTIYPGALVRMTLTGEFRR
ncbi:MAG TPA: glycine zipper 2TM domain-containing protein [Gemmatimonadales bacterium]|nr:glycine zipper 2TM domain-containing protein [Gemmatimonadales bacterium]